MKTKAVGISVEDINLQKLSHIREIIGAIHKINKKASDIQIVYAAKEYIDCVRKDFKREYTRKVLWQKLTPW